MFLYALNLKIYFTETDEGVSSSFEQQSQIVMAAARHLCVISKIARAR